jgi:hypothetical protein
MKHEPVKWRQGHAQASDFSHGGRVPLSDKIASDSIPSCNFALAVFKANFARDGTRAIPHIDTT